MLCGCLFAASCSSANNDAAPPTTATLVDTPVATTAAISSSTSSLPNTRWAQGDSAVIFDQDEFHTFELNLEPEALDRLNGDPVAEIYESGTLTFDGETLDVGVRYKGSIGSFFGCTDEFSFGGGSGIGGIDISGKKTCTKLSLKIKINWAESPLGTSQRFYGLKKLQFHAMNLDSTMMHERLGYYMFREMGIAAPRAVHARVLINGVDTGVYALVEQIDGRFARENFDDGTGNVYKEVWPLTSDGSLQPEENLLASLKTNEDDDPSVALMTNFGEAMAAASTSEELRTALTEWIDIDEFVTYGAVDRTIRNDDGAFHWYCDRGDGACAPHNYYWYEDPTEERLHLVPWDLDHAFATLGSPSNNTIPIIDAFGEVSNDCAPIPGLVIPQRSAACDPIFAALATYQDDYDASVAAFIAGPFSQANTDALLDTWTAQIRDAVDAAAQAFDDAPSLASWDQAVMSFRADLEAARA